MEDMPARLVVSASSFDRPRAVDVDGVTNAMKGAEDTTDSGATRWIQEGSQSRGQGQQSPLRQPDAPWRRGERNTAADAAAEDSGCEDMDDMNAETTGDIIIPGGNHRPATPTQADIPLSLEVDAEERDEPRPQPYHGGARSIYAPSRYQKPESRYRPAHGAYEDSTMYAHPMLVSS